MTAFCACSRFSAWSRITLWGPSSTLVGDLLAPVRGEAVHDQAPGRREAQQAVVDLIALEALRGALALRLPGPC